MSGGYFDYQQYKISQIADDIEIVIAHNDSDLRDEYGDKVGRGYSPEVIQRFQEAVLVLRTAQIYAQRIDWLLSDDDGEESFIMRLDEELGNAK